ncbi:hypothetical protein [Spirillospora sp. NPDC029432]|uniref:hypothetical protein n=1 Tax=Spirillospora sp. NPDC029432 TaxID=3154599 RepID=UPI0034525A0C
MITALVLTSLAGLLVLSLPRRIRRLRRSREPGTARPGLAPRPAPPDRRAAEPKPPGPYPESMTAELEPWEEEYLACLADHLWPEDEYLDQEHRLDHDGDGDCGGGLCR